MFSATSSSSSMPPSSYNSYEKLPRHHLHRPGNNSFYIPLHTLNYFQCVILLYFFVFTVYYHDRYGGKIENVQITSAVFDSNSKELILIFLFDSPHTPRELFLGFGSSDAETLRNETQIELKPPPGFASNRQIFMWSSIENEKPESLTVNAEHPKSLLLRDHTGHPFLELSLQEPYSDFRDVVSCFSPISGDFEMVLTSLTSSIAMGSFVSIPYEELTGELYKFLRIFEKSGNLRLTAFPLIRHEPHLDSTENYYSKMLKLKTDVAFLHCWLMHKNRAKFMVFQNSAEIVLPLSTTLENPVYISEFTTMFEAHRVDGYSILEYNARITTDKRLGDFLDFSIRQAIESSKIEELNGNSRALVMKMHPSNSQNLYQRGKMYPFFKNVPSPPKVIPKKTVNKINRIIEIIEENDAFWTLIKESTDQVMVPTFETVLRDYGKQWIVELTYNFNEIETVEEARRFTMEAIDNNWAPVLRNPVCAGQDSQPSLMNPIDKVKENAENFILQREALKMYISELLQRATSSGVLNSIEAESIREKFWEVELRQQIGFDVLKEKFFKKVSEDYSDEVPRKLETISTEILETDTLLNSRLYWTYY
ncbi:hypothetical protein L5515_011675 [Caenorhabditis briggsae]|uniref:Glycosyltransferase family 92 protein n=1 Tax=Caenorhabditis briggsae TaxID=6238 RepID=A0AAE9ETS1_CAEBR|nr:hypothetical protein L5515_011675 [Caenorhabditis briggsae]